MVEEEKKEEKKVIGTITVTMYGDRESEIVFTGEDVNALEVTYALANVVIQLIGKPEIETQHRIRMLDLVFKEAIQGIANYIRDDKERENFMKKFMSNLMSIVDDCHKFLDTFKNK